MRKHILLLTDIPPCTKYTAGLVQKQLCNFLMEEGIALTIIAIVSSDLSPDISSSVLSYCDKYIQYEKPRENCKGENRTKSILRNTIIRNFYPKYLVSKIIKELSTNQYNILWAVIQGQTMICTVREVAKKLGLPYSVQVWDPPEWWLQANSFDERSKKKVLTEFKNLLKEAACCFAPSKQMAEYVNKFGCNFSIPVIPSLPRILVRRDYYPKEKDFTIVFTGQIYAREELLSFLSALNKLNWKVGDKRIKVKIFSYVFDEDIANKFPIVLQYGWLPQEELLKELANSELCYCPYPFSREMEKVAKLSFPSKLTSYLSSQTPVLVHAPNYSSIANFIIDERDGYVCTSTEEDILIKKIQTIISGYEEHREKIIKNAIDKFNSNLSLEVMKKNFFTALGLFKNENSSR